MNYEQAHFIGIAYWWTGIAVILGLLLRAIVDDT